MLKEKIKNIYKVYVIYDYRLKFVKISLKALKQSNDW